MLDAGLILTFVTLAVLIMGGTGVILWVRRWSRRDTPAEPFTVQDLRDMRARGEITEREYMAMRAALIGRMGIDSHRDELSPPDGASEDT